MRCAYFNTLKQWKKVPWELKRPIFWLSFAVFRHCCQLPWELHNIKKNYARSPHPSPLDPTRRTTGFRFRFSLFFSSLSSVYSVAWSSPLLISGTGLFLSPFIFLSRVTLEKFTKGPLLVKSL